MCVLISFLSFIDLHNGSFIALFTFIIAFFTLKLWLDGSNSSKKELRAYVHVESIEIGGITGVFQHVESIGRVIQTSPPQRLGISGAINGVFCDIHIKNFGKIPSRVRKIFMEIKIEDFPRPNPTNLSITEPVISSKTTGPELLRTIDTNTSIDYGPGETDIRRRDYHGSPMTHDETEGLWLGNKAIYAYGRIEYFDGFSSKIRTTTFRYFWLQSKNSEQMRRHQDGNTTY